MAVFHLHFREGEEFVPDLEGAPYRDLAAARAGAIGAAREILAEELMTGRMSLAQQIEICSEAGQLLDVVHFANAVVTIRYSTNATSLDDRLDRLREDRKAIETNLRRRGDDAVRIGAEMRKLLATLTGTRKICRTAS